VNDSTQSDKIITYVLKTVLDEYLITPREHYVYVQEKDIEPGLEKYFTQVLQKLDQDEGILMLKIAPHTETHDGSHAVYTSYEIKVLVGFLEYCHTRGLYDPVPIIAYDDEHGQLSIKGSKQKQLFLPRSIEGHLFARVLQADGARLRVDGLVNGYEDTINPDKVVDTKAFRNARDRLNEKISHEYNLQDVICYQKSDFWLNSDFVSINSPYRS
jgi:hypothetical protein